MAGSGSAGSDDVNLCGPNYLIADTNNDPVQRCSPVDPFPCSTVAGMGGRGSGIDELFRPCSVAIDALGDYVIVDRFNNRVVQCPAASPGANCTVVASDLRYPRGVSVLTTGSYLIADALNHRVQLCTPSRSSRETGWWNRAGQRK